MIQQNIFLIIKVQIATRLYFVNFENTNIVFFLKKKK